MAILVNPKGGKAHKKSGRYYYYSYIGVILTASVLLTLKFKIFLPGAHALWHLPDYCGELLCKER